MRHHHHEPGEHLNGATLDIGLMLGRLQGEMRQIRIEVERQGQMVARLMQRSAPIRNSPSFMSEAAEFLKLLLPIVAIGLLVAGRIGAGDALALLKIALSGG